MRTWTKRDPVKNYFPLPNEIYQLGLSHGAIAVYGYLLRIEDRRTYQCHPSYATIGKAVGIVLAPAFPVDVQTAPHVLMSHILHRNLRKDHSRIRLIHEIP